MKLTHTKHKFLTWTCAAIIRAIRIPKGIKYVCIVFHLFLILKYMLGVARLTVVVLFIVVIG